MSMHEDYAKHMGTGSIGRPCAAAKLEGKPQDKGKAKPKKQPATLGPYASEVTKLENYILGSSAAIITNVGLLVGLGSASTGKGPILGGLLTFALADNLSDSLGIQWYKESEGFENRRSLLATAVNFLSRLLISVSFIAIVLIFSTSQAIFVGIAWALLLLNLVSYLIARTRHRRSVLEIVKNVLLAIFVIALSRGVGYLIAQCFS